MVDNTLSAGNRNVKWDVGSEATYKSNWVIVSSDLMVGGRSKIIESRGSRRRAQGARHRAMPLEVGGALR